MIWKNIGIKIIRRIVSQSASLLVPVYFALSFLYLTRTFSLPVLFLLCFHLHSWTAQPPPVAATFHPPHATLVAFIAALNTQSAYRYDHGRTKFHFLLSPHSSSRQPPFFSHWTIDPSAFRSKEYSLRRTYIHARIRKYVVRVVPEIRILCLTDAFSRRY